MIIKPLYQKLYILAIGEIAIIGIVLTAFFELYKKNNKGAFWLVSSLIAAFFAVLIFLPSWVRTETFHFEVTKPKQCDGGMYLHQGNEMCEKMWSTSPGIDELATYNCLDCIGGNCSGQGLYNGRPLNMESVTPLSNDNWQNETCNDPILETDRPRVL